MAELPEGRHDSAMRRRAQRHGREGGCRVYIPAEALVEAGFNPADDAPYYTTRGFRRSKNGRSVIVSLYREP